jgi:hypothetical protein
LTEKVAYLMRRDQESQQALNSMARRVETIETDTPTKLEQLRGEMQMHVEARLSSRLADLRAARLWGVAALLFGLAIGTVANLLSLICTGKGGSWRDAAMTLC